MILFLDTFVCKYKHCQSSYRYNLSNVNIKDIIYFCPIKLQNKQLKTLLSFLDIRKVCLSSPKKSLEKRKKKVNHKLRIKLKIKRLGRRVLRLEKSKFFIENYYISTDFIHHIPKL